MAIINSLGDLSLEGKLWKLTFTYWEKTSLLNNGLVITNQTSTNNYAIILKGDADITFYNTLGVAVKQSALNEGENIINAEDLKAGVYIWKTLSDENIINTGKIVKK